MISADFANARITKDPVGMLNKIDITIIYQFTYYGTTLYL